METRNNENEIVHQITPKFNFIYELGMPTGKKIKSTLIMLFIFIIGYIVYLTLGSNVRINVGNNFNVVSILNIVLIIGMIFSVIKLIIHIVMQNLQYKNITYTFYNDHMTYEDSFLNQHKKNIEYANVKEVEIRRSVWDRILGYGIVVIYTNAENEYSNGLVIFSIKDPKYHYDIIDKLVHSPEIKNNTISNSTSIIKNEVQEEIPNNITLEESKESSVNDVENVEETHEEFLESLKQVKDEEDM